MTPKVKLTRKQVEIIRKMRDGWTLFYTSRLCAYILESDNDDTEDIDYRDMQVLEDNNLIERIAILYTLTPLGKQIEL